MDEVVAIDGGMRVDGRPVDRSSRRGDAPWLATT
jgi:hypothetical protein